MNLYRNFVTRGTNFAIYAYVCDMCFARDMPFGRSVQGTAIFDVPPNLAVNKLVYRRG